MLKVTKDNPCPICGKSNWCLVAEDGSVAICARISEGSVKKVGTEGAGWLHRLTDAPKQRKYYTKPKPVKQGPTPDFFAMARECFIRNKDKRPLMAELGVSADSLFRLQLGWDGKNFTFPMRDGFNKIVGIRLRSATGGKFAVKGSKNALFWPVGVKADSKNLLFICEGPTDTAALLDLGFDAIGRASCGTGLDYIKTMIGDMDRQIVIMADKDEVKYRPDGSPYYPGIEGALMLAQELKPVVRSIRVVKPARYKDVRKWKQNGATASQVMALVNNGKFL